VTPEEINALPERVRTYIHDLETRCDPAGDLRALRLAQDENRMLREKLARERDAADAAHFRSMMYDNGFGGSR
jgi:hypothetical protein